MSPSATFDPERLGNIQGDILFGLQKRFEEFVFFEIKDVAHFRSKLATDIHGLITPAQKVAEVKEVIELWKRSRMTRLLPLVHVNLAFSSSGLKVLLEKDVDLRDPVFEAGQYVDAEALGDPGLSLPGGVFTPAWETPFTKTIHGVFLIAADCEANLDAGIQEILDICKTNAGSSSIDKIVSIRGRVREGANKGHEFFGFNDGLSQPAIEGVHEAHRGVQVIKPGIILLNNPGDVVFDEHAADPNKPSRPEWATDGSFLVFRKLAQLVPEFQQFLDTKGGSQAGSDRFGARLMGRWKSGAPIDLFPNGDPFGQDPGSVTDRDRVNDFQYKNDNDQIRCPFVAHTRKTTPRSDIPEEAQAQHRIIRAGIPYGPEVSKAEDDSHTTTEERGLAFVSYQSSVEDGFRFIQRSWANNRGFRRPDVGFDAIVGQAGNGPRDVVDPGMGTEPIDLPSLWVIPKGGEYFLAPSLSAIKSVLGKA